MTYNDIAWGEAKALQGQLVAWRRTLHRIPERGMKLPIWQALRKSYKNTIPSIMTSGLILILCPYIVSMLLTDPTISLILHSISVGALSAILLIIFVLPGLLAAFDKIVVKKGSHP